MVSRRHLARLTWCGLALACRTTPPAAAPHAPATTQTEERPMPTETMIRDDRSAILDELRTHGHAAPDFPKTFPAVDVDGWVPMQTTSKTLIAGQPVFFRSPDRTAYGVDRKILSELTVVDTTSLSKGETSKVGRLLRADAPPLDVVRCLIQADVLLTWAHIGSEVRLFAPEQDGPRWHVDVDGTHTYFTNEENVDAFAFRVSLDDQGVITVVGR